ncbi:hypothetical protein AB0O31_10180 [Kitasatospora cineracea]|uniref:hypothetical protein n=1 Tax=Kitasatospora cineracea TaxID=88074 RepID=UPI003416DDB8
MTAVKPWPQHATVRNVTVAKIHTYYVLAGATPVLVHNCGNASADGLYVAATGNAKGQLTPAGRALQKHGDPSPGNIAKRG